MERVLRKVAVTLSVLAVLISGSAGAAGATGAADPGGTGAQRTRWQADLDDLVGTGAVGALAEVRDGRAVWRGVGGVAEVGTRHPVPVTGRFRIGSISKTFLATVVLQLVAEGRLGLDDPLDAWLPGEVPDGDRITVRELLSHTSGLYDVVRTLPMPPSREFYENRWRRWTADELIRRAVANPPAFEPPGSAYAYSNTDYLLLGWIVERVTGRPYREEIGRRILRPLRLRGTTSPGGSPWVRGPHPHGYVPTPRGALLDYTAMNPSVFGAAGDMISTTRDLDTFFAALLGGRLLPPALLREMETPVRRDAPYGLGMFVKGTSCGVRVYGHDGDALAYQSWSYATRDGRRQASIALTPDFSADLDDAVDAFLDDVFCP